MIHKKYAVLIFIGSLFGGLCAGWFNDMKEQERVCELHVELGPGERLQLDLSKSCWMKRLHIFLLEQTTEEVDRVVLEVQRLVLGQKFIGSLEIYINGKIRTKLQCGDDDASSLGGEDHASNDDAISSEDE